MARGGKQVGHLQARPRGWDNRDQIQLELARRTIPALWPLGHEQLERLLAFNDLTFTFPRRIAL